MKKTNDLSSLKLIGKLKVLTETCINGDKFSGLPIGGIISKRMIIFNDKGYIIESTFNSDFLDKFSKYTRKYYEKGNLIEEYSYESSNKLISKSIYKLASKTIYKYNNKGYKVEETSYKSDLGLKNKNVYKYDDKGNTIEEISYDQSGIFSKFTRLFDDKGNCIETSSFNKYDERERYSSNYKSYYRYDNEGNNVEQILYDLDDCLICKHIYEYNEDGDKVDEIKYSYDDNGNEIKSQDVELGPFPFNNIYEYLYDSVGNWIKQICFIDGYCIETIERELEYY